MRATNLNPLLLTLLVVACPHEAFAGGVPFTSDDLNLESAINSNAVVLDLLGNDDSGINNDDYKEVIAVCDINSSDQDCTGNSYSDAIGSVSINGTGNNNNVVLTSDGNASALFQFKYVMQNSAFSTGTAVAEVALSYVEVNSLSDSGSGGCDSAECTLREAIVFAANDGEASLINFARDLNGTIVLSNQLTIDSIDLSIIGPGANSITVSGNDQNRVFMVPAGSERFFMSGLTISNGKTFVNDSGAGILIENATETRFENLRITDNDSIQDGGGLFISNAGFIMINSEISLNSANNNGGGIAISGGFGNEVIIENVTISNNQSSNFGDGLFINSSSGQNTLLRFVTAAFNFGGITDNHIAGAGNVTIESSVFDPGLSIPNSNNITNNSIFKNLSDGNIFGSNNLTDTDDLFLEPLAEINNSGFYGHSFDTNSLLYNHVDNMIGNAGCEVTVTSDQFGNPRPTDGQCDAGAYEYIYIDLIFTNGFE
ncbi:choice-of-anchor Q domain-containing protein [Marinicella litoralis]|uniref:CSLREA domain-containing protein n=1 Tax=Marinicella litoralis TaxID=644220 RepID=A0A4R6XIR5_9GAMM|nr:choice-of-anchor Q domain-containing protein [Marinicella litoralis]TDR19376.1 CSLREA domain-containing protein [Marinicella litoralis]